MATITPNFKLKNPESKTPTLIYLKLYYNKERFVYSTGLTVRPELWDKENDRTYQKNTAPEGVSLTKEDIRQAAIIDNELNRYKTETARIFDHFTYQAIQPTNELIKHSLKPQIVFNGSGGVACSVLCCPFPGLNVLNELFDVLI